MTKVLLCSPKGSVGGICKWTENILSFYAATTDNDIELEWFYTAVPPMPVGKRSVLSRILSGYKTYKPFLHGLKKHLKENDYDIVHFSTSGSFSFLRDYYALKRCKKKGMRTAVHFHFGRIADVLKGNSLEKRLFDKCIPYIDAFVAMDEKSYKALMDYGCKNVYNVPNPLSPQTEALVGELTDIPREKNKIVFAGHVLRTKGVFELVEACHDIPGITLDILGECDGIVRQQLMELAGDNAEEWLKIPGNRTATEVITAMKTCTVFVLPSYSEGFPNVIIEAMACGTPIIATSVGAIPQMLAVEGGDTCGVLIKPRSVQVLRDAITNVLSNVKYASTMGAVAKEKVNNAYSMPTVWQKLKEVWQS